VTASVRTHDLDAQKYVRYDRGDGWTEPSGSARKLATLRFFRRADVANAR
jgi:hypothetical protein